MNSDRPSLPIAAPSADIVSSIDELISILRHLFEEVNRIQTSMEKASSRLLENPTYQSELSIHHKHMLDFLALIKNKLQAFLSFPPFHVRHMTKLEEFHRGASFDQSIFIMTKYPEGNGEIDASLKRVIDAVAQSISACGFYPRLASDYDYHSLLWDNVELYLLGSCRAVAIVEDRYKPELNPNVAMEWGWMRGMGKDTLFLVEKDFKHFRADWSGITKYPFAWENPEIEIKTAIEKWLQNRKQNT